MALSICTQLLLTDRYRTPQPGGLASLRTGELGQAGDSARMDARRYPSFADVYANYFHEDWRHDDVSAVGVVKRYLRVAPPEEVLMADLGPFTNYDPAEDGLTVEQ